MVSKNLQKRIISAGILAPIVLYIVFVGGLLFTSLVVIATVIMSFEWASITLSDESITKEAKQKWRNGGIAYISLFACSLIYLRSAENGLWLVLLLLAIVWATDIAAFFVGRTLKGPKILPKISPNKTWSGLLGGTVAAAAVGFFASVFTSELNMLSFVFICAILAPVAQAGDFFESWVKRKFGVKDSGDIIPGHGGLLDRIDGLTSVAPIMAIVSLFW